MLSSARRNLIQQLYEEAFNDGNLAPIDRWVSETYIDHGPLVVPVSGRLGLKKRIDMIRDAFADIQFTVDEVLVEANRVAFRWTLIGMHTGPFEGIPASGNQVVITGLGLAHMAGDQIIEQWMQFDKLALYRQIEAVPSPLQLTQ